jgi:hypothetical protein
VPASVSTGSQGRNGQDEPRHETQKDQPH